jgi:hypothetical protein
MICEKCKEQGKTSTIFITGSLQRPFPHQAHYNEEGVYHDHDPNKYPQGFECSNNHIWVTENPLPCPAEGCDFKP